MVYRRNSDEEKRELVRLAAQGDTDAQHQLLIHLYRSGADVCDISRDVRYSLAQLLLSCEEFPKVSYGEYLQDLVRYDEKQLASNIFLYDMHADEYQPLSDWGECEADSCGEVLDDGHPYLIYGVICIVCQTVWETVAEVENCRRTPNCAGSLIPCHSCGELNCDEPNCVRCGACARTTGIMHSLVAPPGQLGEISCDECLRPDDQIEDSV